MKISTLLHFNPHTTCTTIIFHDENIPGIPIIIMTISYMFDLYKCILCVFIAIHMYISSHHDCVMAMYIILCWRYLECIYSQLYTIRFTLCGTYKCRFDSIVHIYYRSDLTATIQNVQALPVCFFSWETCRIPRISLVMHDSDEMEISNSDDLDFLVQ